MIIGMWVHDLTIRRCVAYRNEQFCWIYLNYLTLRSKVKVPRKSLRYATHRLRSNNSNKSNKTLTDSSYVHDHKAVCLIL
jgi:hypothetical protein